ncbi:MAG TPA: DUF3343 domain-containing protein, partial [Ignavibacteria bacterium]|nr:DUF3343 domain-containing protein [Ignavibacteria bacterium]
SIHFVMKAEKIFLQAGLSFDIIPTPKHLSSECGMSIRLKDREPNITEFTDLLISHNINFEIYE